MKERLFAETAGYSDHQTSLFLNREMPRIPQPSIPEVEKRKEPLYKTLSAPLEVQLELTDLCNQSCIHCYNYWREQDHHRERTLSEDELTSVIQKLKNNGVFRITITGGEPLLFKNRVFETIRLAVKNNIDCNLNSNLSTVTPEDALRLKESGVSFVLTSLPSYEAETNDFITQTRGSFKRTLRGIELLVKTDVKVGVNMVLSQFNQNQIYETGRFLRELGINYFYATKASPPLNSKEFSRIAIDKEALKDSLAVLMSLKDEFGLEVDILECYPLCLIADVNRYEQFARHNCRAGITTCTIGANGEVRPCSHSDQIYGNILSEPLKYPWDRMTEWRDGSLIPNTCQSCQHLRMCSGGCRMEAKYYGKINDMDPFASSPENVILPTQKETQPLNLKEFVHESLTVNPTLRMRVEDFGGILKSKGSEFVFVNQGLFDLVQGIQKQKFFTPCELGEKIGQPLEKTEKIFYYLYSQNIFISRKK